MNQQQARTNCLSLLKSDSSIFPSSKSFDKEILAKLTSICSSDGHSPGRETLFCSNFTSSNVNLINWSQFQSIPILMQIGQYLKVDYGILLSKYDRNFLESNRKISTDFRVNVEYRSSNSIRKIEVDILRQPVRNVSSYCNYKIHILSPEFKNQKKS
uniref:Uncharacterized protein n=1 Tax=Romanomermis culicivorax TaxID=13658 RepID=A0A915HDT2_ROMCU